MSREPNDPAVIMLAAVARSMARDELAALHRISASARRFVEAWDRFTATHDMDDPDLLVRWLSHERRDRAETWDMVEEIKRMRDNADTYDRCDRLQGELNRIRLALMGDPDFHGGRFWEEIIQDCETTAAAANKRRT